MAGTRLPADPPAPHELAETELPQAPELRAGARFLVILDDGELRRLPLGETGTVVLGRAPECDVRLKGASVSRRHLRLYLGTPVEVEDLGSANGTMVGDQKLAAGTRRVLPLRTPVSLGDTILVLQPRPGGERAAPEDSREERFVVEDPAMQELHRTARKAAGFQVPVLILGETGSGKEVLAEVIHRDSTRAGGPFIRINCAAIAPGLAESELFGHERGAFTGAIGARPGPFEAADGGSLFLDEVAELPLSMQTKLLRVLETGEVTRVGGVRPRKFDVRFITATNRDLERAVEAGDFRRDLFFRLNTVTLRMPPLRERRAEIAPLARFFLRRAAADQGAATHLRLNPEAEQALLAHNWPGNVRELRNVIFRAAVLATGADIEVGDLALAPSGGRSRPAAPAPRPDDPSSPQAERERIEAALIACGGNQRRAAEMLGLSLRTLVRRLTALGVPRPRPTRR